MENPTGKVVAVDRADPQARALVEMDAKVQCLRCSEGRGCGAGLFGGTTSSRRIDALIGTGVTVAAGDEVRIELAPKNVLRAALIVYGAPLCGAVIGALIGYAAGLLDLYAALAALAGLVSGLLLARAQLQSAGCLHRFTPTVVARMTTPGSADG